MYLCCHQINNKGWDITTNRVRGIALCHPCYLHKVCPLIDLSLGWRLCSNYNCNLDIASSWIQGFLHRLGYILRRGLGQVGSFTLLAAAAKMWHAYPLLWSYRCPHLPPLHIIRSGVWSHIYKNTNGVAVEWRGVEGTRWWLAIDHSRLVFMSWWFHSSKNWLPNFGKRGCREYGFLSFWLQNIGKRKAILLLWFYESHGSLNCVWRL